MDVSTGKDNRRVCNNLASKVPYKYQPQEALYSFQAPNMACQFPDDCSDSDDGDDSDDSDYMQPKKKCCVVSCDIFIRKRLHRI